ITRRDATPSRKRPFGSADDTRDSATIIFRDRMTNNAALFPRNFRKTFPIVVCGEGSWLISADGSRFLDASGQAAVVSIGHGVAEVGRALAEQSPQVPYAHTTQFHSAPAEKLAARLLQLAPPNF